MGTLAALYFTGVLDAKRENLEREKAMLAEEVRVFSSQRDQLQADRDGLKAETDQLQAEKTQLEADRARLGRGLAQVEQEKARLDATVRPLRESLGEILSAAEEGIRQNRLATTKTRVYYSLFGCAEVVAGDSDIVAGDDSSPGGGFSAQERAALSATQQRSLADYEEHEKQCRTRRPAGLAALPADQIVVAAQTWLQEYDDCLRGWVLPKRRNG